MHSQHFHCFWGVIAFPVKEIFTFPNQWEVVDFVEYSLKHFWFEYFGTFLLSIKTSLLLKKIKINKDACPQGLPRTLEILFVKVLWRKKKHKHIIRLRVWWCLCRFAREGRGLASQQSARACAHMHEHLPPALLSAWATTPILLVFSPQHQWAFCNQRNSSGSHSNEILRSFGKR